MINPKIKICGISDIEILKQLINLNLDYVGFIFYSKSPRFVDEVFLEKIQNIDLELIITIKSFSRNKMEVLIILIF